MGDLGFQAYDVATGARLSTSGSFRTDCSSPVFTHNSVSIEYGTPSELCSTPSLCTSKGLDWHGNPVNAFAIFSPFASVSETVLTDKHSCDCSAYEKSSPMRGCYA